MAQFDKLVVIQAKGGRFGSGGTVLFNVSKPPKKLTLKQLSEKYTKMTRGKPLDFYSREDEDVAGSTDGSSNSGIIGTLTSKPVKIGVLVAMVLLGIFLVYKLVGKKSRKFQGIILRNKK